MSAFQSMKEVAVEAVAGASCQHAPCPICSALPWRHPGAHDGDIDHIHPYRTGSRGKTPVRAELRMPF